jgi:CheY-like chemotaxis protein
MLDGFVLVVDDNPETLNLIASTLEMEGIPVKTATSVLRALEALHESSAQPVAIITDLMMPQTTGWDFLKHLRSEPAMQALPLVVITGAEPGESTSLADVVLQKPVDPAKVALTIRQLVHAKSIRADPIVP